MAHYAKVNNGIVEQVIVAEEDFFDTFLDTFLGTNPLIQRRKCLIYIW
jgi:hypothetical protein